MRGLLIALALTTLLTVPAEARKKIVPQPQTFDEAFENEVKAANGALKTYTNTPCSAPEFSEAASSLFTEAKALTTLYQNIPEVEDDVLQAHQVELFIGFATLTEEAISLQKECVNDLTNPVSPAPNS